MPDLHISRSMELEANQDGMARSLLGHQKAPTCLVVCCVCLFVNFKHYFQKVTHWSDSGIGVCIFGSIRNKQPKTNQPSEEPTGCGRVSHLLGVNSTRGDTVSPQSLFLPHCAPKTRNSPHAPERVWRRFRFPRSYPMEPPGLPRVPRDPREPCL